MGNQLKTIAFVLISSLISGCSTFNIKDKAEVANYLQTHDFVNDKGSVLGFSSDGVCACVTPDGTISCTYSIEPVDDDEAKIIIPGCFTTIPFEWTINNDGQIFCSSYVDGAYKVFSVYKPSGSHDKKMMNGTSQQITTAPMNSNVQALAQKRISDSLSLASIRIQQDKAIEMARKSITISIDSQEWATSNLNETTFRNGDPIPEAESAEEWKKASDEGKPAWCYYDGKHENGIKYGKLYNWYAVIDSRGLAPVGWHIPTNLEWFNLLNNLEGKTNHNNLTEPEWESDGTDFNSGFLVLFAGFRMGVDGVGNFDDIGNETVFWSSSYDPDKIFESEFERGEEPHDMPYAVHSTVRFVKLSTLHGGTGFDDVGVYYRGNGFSVRCIKDNSSSQDTTSRALTNQDNQTQAPQLESSRTNQSEKTVTAIVDKAYFYSAPDVSKQRNAYCVKGEEVKYIAVSANGNFIFVSFIFPSGNKTEGWMLKSDFGL